MKQLKRIKGTQDILPEKSPQWQALERHIRREMALFNFREIRTPVFEMTEVFARGIGQFTDIVSKEMYTFQDRSRKSLTLKPEMTAPVMRAFIENTLYARTPVHKLYYLAPLFRQENPQAGRLRQFHQYGAEFIGSPAPEADVETILLALHIFEGLGLKNMELRINSVGDPESREPYKALLRDYLSQNIPDPEPVVAERIANNPLRVLDSKDENLQEVIQQAPKLIDHLKESAAAHYHSVKAQLSKAGVGFREDPTLVRGLDYYTHTVFEVTSDALGAQNALCGGGRYDLLARELGDKDFPAVGFAAGMERILMALEAQGIQLAEPEAPDIFMITMGQAAREEMTPWLVRLRRAGLSADADFLGRSVKAQFREANRSGARFSLILGEDELEQKFFSVKDMKNSTQENVPFGELTGYLLQKRKD
ncbi:MAG TPA: histidine--tRNA ligase [Caldithrix abyssi]|uniref:Histidine--tRNA ligase n=1 Tax=Caldithrix abyssi TaxID=187145 RepID=A0A7V1LNR0_CALAY|nr:histidine--tRNA ligase [Caldithrix abyssi]